MDNGGNGRNHMPVGRRQIEYSFQRREFGKRLTIHPIKELKVMMIDLFYVDYIRRVE